MQRYSKNREAILECLRGTKCHPTAEWVYEELKKEHPNMSVATVYRNLAQLKEAGMIRSMGIVSGYEHFDGNVEPHSHVVCSKCGRIEDLDDNKVMSELVSKVSKLSGYAVSDMSFVGLCPECNESSN